MLRILCPMLLVVCFGCEQTTPPPSAIRVEGQSQVAYDLVGTATVGNHSFIPLNIPGNPYDWRQEILGLLDQFEQQQGVEIISFQVEKQQKAYITGQYIWGIWVTHRPVSTLAERPS